VAGSSRHLLPLQECPERVCGVHPWWQGVGVP